MIIDMDEEVLEHYGVKGMKWGTRRASSSDRPSFVARRSKNRQLNKAARAKDRDKHTRTVDAARKRVDSGKTKADWKAAKRQHKQNKADLGSYEARKALNKAREKRMKDIETSKQYRDGREALLGTMLEVALAGAANKVGSSSSDWNWD